MTVLPTPATLVSGLEFPEGPRWFGGRLWFSDVRAKVVSTVGLDGTVDQVVRMDDGPSGIGFLPDGAPIVVSMYERRIVRVTAQARLERHADLRSFHGDYLNDMVVDEGGNAYVGLRSAALRPGEPLPSGTDAPDSLLLVRPDGTASIAAPHLISPNGCAITPDGRTLLLAETYRRRILAFDRRNDGTLGEQRVFADVAPHYPDGLCLDVTGAVWIGSPYTGAFLQVREGGDVTCRIDQAGAVACMLGGAGRRVLFLLAVDPSALRFPGEPARPVVEGAPVGRGGSIAVVPVPDGGVGLP